METANMVKCAKFYTLYQYTSIMYIMYIAHVACTLSCVPYPVYWG